MRTGKTSRSAIGVTLARACESARPPEIRVCDDPFAVHFLEGRARLFYTILMNRWLRSILRGVSRNPVPGAILGYVPLRTRFIDDRLRGCIQEGLEQLVILGAGFDSRAYRFDEMRNGIRVYEVDHPATLRTKLHRIEKLLGSIPKHVTHVSVDFEQDDLYEELRKSGYETNLTTMFIWEGVSYYLEAEAVDRTLAFVSSKCKSGSSIVFDYLPLDVVNRTSRLPLATGFLDYVEDMGEPVKFGIESGHLDAFLSRRGFLNVKTVSVEQCKEEYHTADHRDTPVLGIFSIVHAAVLP
jgi:methyltransferase (TIGR00027 family)